MKKLELFIILTILLTGCFNYRDMNKLLFATVTLVDIDDRGNISIYAEAFKAFRGKAEQAGTEKRVLLKGTGKTIYDAFINMSQSADFEIDYSQNKALIFTKKAAEHGLDDFLDASKRDQKPTIRQYLFVYTGDNPEGFIKTQLNDEPFLGLFLINLMESQERLGKIYALKINDYYNYRLSGSTVSIIPILIKPKNQLTEKIEIHGGAVIDHDKMVDILTPDEIVPYNYATRRNRDGIILADSPDSEGKYISLKILGSSSNISVTYDGSTIHLYKKINVKASIVESQSSLFPMNDEERLKIEESAEASIKRGCIDLFEKYKERNIDIYNVTRLFQVKYPNIKINNMLSKTESESVEVSVTIEGSQNTTSFY